MASLKENRENQPSNERVDKLLCAGVYENGNDRNRRPSKDKAKDLHLETVESPEKASMGIAEVRD